MRGLLTFFAATFVAWIIFFGLVYFFSEGNDGLPADADRYIFSLPEKPEEEAEGAATEATSGSSGTQEATSGNSAQTVSGVGQSAAGAAGSVMNAVAEAAGNAAGAAAEQVRTELQGEGAATADDGYVTPEKLSRIEDGMSYNEVAYLIGRDGRRIYEDDFGGVLTEEYEWDSLGGGVDTFLFQNHVLVREPDGDWTPHDQAYLTNAGAYGY